MVKKSNVSFVLFNFTIKVSGSFKEKTARGSFLRRLCWKNTADMLYIIYNFYLYNGILVVVPNYGP